MSTTSSSRVALTGAGGRLGTVLRPALLARCVALRSVGGSHPLAALSAQEDICNGDLRDPAFVDRALAGVDVLVHMAGTSGERALADIIDNNLRALVEVYEGARRHGLRRVVFASSNHAFGMYPVSERLELDAAVRPDGFYGLSKVWGEALARMYWDKHGIEGICLRIGSAMEKPTEQRHLRTWLGHEDLVQLVMRCLAAPAVGFLQVWGVSNNARSYWSNDDAVHLGYHPVQNAEDYAAQIPGCADPLEPAARDYQGGRLAALSLTPPERRRR
jgi:uronate dehydrogenase